MLCLMLKKGFLLLQGLCRHKQFWHEEKHQCEKTEPVIFKKKKKKWVSMKFVFSRMNEEFWMAHLDHVSLPLKPVLFTFKQSTVFSYVSFH